jgi:hypothetical protein
VEVEEIKILSGELILADCYCGKLLERAIST